MPESLDIKEVIRESGKFLLIDVRSEGEYAQAHIPGAVNIPLLNDEARKIVGTTYKQKGHEMAVKAGFDLMGHRFSELYSKYCEAAGDQSPVFYCWRGGLRSRISATLFEWGKGASRVIKGGYKAYRREVLKSFDQQRKLIVISGFTGVGKTEILKLLKNCGSQIVDLEALAHHKGSALGALGQEPQPRQEMFENLLFEQWHRLDTQNPVYIENESRKIGGNVVPEGIWNQLADAPVIDIVVDRDVRLHRILDEYGHFEINDLAEATTRLKKRLGGQNLKEALSALQEGNIREWASILMDYYDRTYLHSRKERIMRVTPFRWDWSRVDPSLEKFRTIVP